MTTTPLAPEVKQQIVLSAYAAVGAGDPESTLALPEQIRQKVIELTIAAQDALNDKSPLAKAIKDIEESSPFVAVLINGSKDERNSRVHLRFRAENGPGQNADADGTETIATDPDYWPSGAALIAKARGLIGHRVLLYKGFDNFVDNGQARKMKVLRAVVDLGMPKEESAAA